MNQLTKIDRAAFEPQPESLDFAHLRIFNSVPPHGYDVALLHGMVVVHDREIIDREGVRTGQFYVRETQHAPCALNWSRWLEMEMEARDRRASPNSPLKTRREVVQAIEHPANGEPAFRLASGTIDGPFHEWSYGWDLIGKVVGVYLPRAREA
jgi:hypothetical protein